jgi:hypothetical protein
MEHVNLWQLRADCLRSLGEQFCDEASEQQQIEIDQDFRSPRERILEVEFCDDLYDALCVGDDERPSFLQYVTTQNCEGGARPRRRPLRSLTKRLHHT